MQRLLCLHYGASGFQIEPRHNANGLTDAINRYFAGELEAIRALPVKTGGTPFQRQVWRALRKDSRCGFDSSPTRSLLNALAVRPHFVPLGLPMAQIRLGS